MEIPPIGSTKPIRAYGIDSGEKLAELLDGPVGGWMGVVTLVCRIRRESISMATKAGAVSPDSGRKQRNRRGY
jgi:hypothetical protein